MVINYEHGKIYKITSEKSGLTYYGSTSEYYLSKRLTGHIRKYKCYLNGKYHYCSSFELLKQEDYNIQLIKNFPCANRKQLETEEGKYIRENKCVNKITPGRTQKQYRKDNKEKVKEIDKQYREANKEKQHEKNKEYNAQNKDMLKEKASKPYQCECGSVVRWGSKLPHFKTVKHCEFVNMPQH